MVKKIFTLIITICLSLTLFTVNTFADVNVSYSTSSDGNKYPDSTYTVKMCKSGSTKLFDVSFNIDTGKVSYIDYYSNATKGFTDSNYDVYQRFLQLLFNVAAGTNSGPIDSYNNDLSYRTYYTVNCCWSLISLPNKQYSIYSPYASSKSYVNLGSTSATACNDSDYLRLNYGLEENGRTTITDSSFISLTSYYNDTWKPSNSIINTYNQNNYSTVNIAGGYQEITRIHNQYIDSSLTQNNTWMSAAYYNNYIFDSDTKMMKFNSSNNANQISYYPFTSDVYTHNSSLESVVSDNYVDDAFSILIDHTNKEIILPYGLDYNSYSFFYDKGTSLAKTSMIGRYTFTYNNGSTVDYVDSTRFSSLCDSIFANNSYKVWKSLYQLNKGCYWNNLTLNGNDLQLAVAQTHLYVSTYVYDHQFTDVSQNYWKDNDIVKQFKALPANCYLIFPTVGLSGSAVGNYYIYTDPELAEDQALYKLTKNQIKYSSSISLDNVPKTAKHCFRTGYNISYMKADSSEIQTDKVYDYLTIVRLGIVNDKYIDAYLTGSLPNDTVNYISITGDGDMTTSFESDWSSDYNSSDEDIDIGELEDTSLGSCPFGIGDSSIMPASLDTNSDLFSILKQTDTYIKGNDTTMSYPYKAGLYVTVTNSLNKTTTYNWCFSKSFNVTDNSGGYVTVESGTNLSPTWSDSNNKGEVKMFTVNSNSPTVLSDTTDKYFDYFGGYLPDMQQSKSLKLYAKTFYAQIDGIRTPLNRYSNTFCVEQNGVDYIVTVTLIYSMNKPAIYDKGYSIVSYMYPGLSITQAGDDDLEHTGGLGNLGYTEDGQYYDDTTGTIDYAHTFDISALSSTISNLHSSLDTYNDQIKGYLSDYQYFLNTDIGSITSNSDFMSSAMQVKSLIEGFLGNSYIEPVVYVVEIISIVLVAIF